MSNYGELLKSLIKFTDMKMSSVADIAGYDISYISKWCNKSKLPASRVAGSVNRSLARAFADEILEQNELDSFCHEFSVTVRAEQLETYIYTILKSAFKNSMEYNNSQIKKASVPNSRVLISRYEIDDYMTRELPALLRSSQEPVDVLCTLDICQILQETPMDYSQEVLLSSPIRVKIGINTENISKSDYLALYSLINKYHYISFDFYDNVNFRGQNLIVIKNQAAILCSVDQTGKITLAVVITDPEKVDKLYERTAAMFKINHLLIMATSSKEMMQTGYRSNFYAYGDFQMFLARGCEFFLPPDIIDSIIKSSYEQGFDEYMEKFFRKLIVTWDDIFRKEKSDFYILKSTLLKYIEDGELYFTDVMHRMTVDERKAHIAHVLKEYSQNENLNFYIIDEEKIHFPTKLINFSLFNNHKKLFLKNINRFHCEYGPQFYSILNEKIIADITKYMDELKDYDSVTHYNATSLPEFMDRYGGMVYKMLSLSELNDFCL
ncbi:MAG: hypothetical protein PUD43_06350 [Clostridia bacterium]|nr:hypothetical protein [Clostridia bacterium]